MKTNERLQLKSPFCTSKKLPDTSDQTSLRKPTFYSQRYVIIKMNLPGFLFSQNRSKALCTPFTTSQLSANAPIAAPLGNGTTGAAGESSDNA